MHIRHIIIRKKDCAVVVQSRQCDVVIWVSLVSTFLLVLVCILFIGKFMYVASTIFFLVLLLCSSIIEIIIINSMIVLKNKKIILSHILISKIFKIKSTRTSVNFFYISTHDNYYSPWEY